MENMLHLATPHTSVPERYVFHRDKVPPASSSSAASLPIIDLSRARDEVRRAVLDAGRELGFFQVVNHGVPEQIMRDMESVCEEFFRLPAADKAGIYSEDKRRPNRLFSGTTYYDTGGEMYWRDCLRLVCPAGDDDSSMDNWPDKPHRLRKVVKCFAMATRGVAMEILRLLCEAMGLRPDYFEGGFTGGHTTLDVNHYPRCPDPSVTLGLPPHCDRALITVLLPGAVPGLEVADGNGGWIKVHPVPGAFVVNFGLQLEVVTNGMLKSIEHRAVTNAAAARTSVATFIVPTADCLVGPEKELLGKDNPPCYRTMTFREFNRVYNAVNLGSSINITTNIKNIQKTYMEQNN